MTSDKQLMFQKLKPISLIDCTATDGNSSSSYMPSKSTNVDKTERRLPWRPVITGFRPFLVVLRDHSLSSGRGSAPDIIRSHIPSPGLRDHPSSFCVQPGSAAANRIIKVMPVQQSNYGLRKVRKWRNLRPLTLLHDPPVLISRFYGNAMSGVR
jgi:hypothetical protein